MRVRSELGPAGDDDCGAKAVRGRALGERDGSWAGIRRASGAVMLGLCGAVSCGGQPSAANAQQPAPAPIRQTASSAQKPTVEKQPAPSGLFLVGRVKASDQLVSRIGGWCNLPFGINDALSLVSEELPNLVELDSPIDFAASIPPEPEPSEPVQLYTPDFDWQDGGVPLAPREPSPVHAVATVAVKDPAALVAAVEAAGKEVMIEEDGDVAIELEHDLHCLLTPSAGPTAHRLACGAYPEDVQALAGYVNTALVTEALPDKAAYFELRMAPFRDKHGEEVRALRPGVPQFLKEVTIGNERFDRAMADAVPAVVEEIIAWADGLDTWNFSLDFAAGRDVLVGESTVRFRRAESYVADLLRRGATQAAPAPALFWDLPRDVDSASFSGTIAATPSDDKIADAISELLAGALEHGGVAAGTLDSWVTSLRALMDSRGTVVWASGSLPVETGKSGTSSASTKPSVKAKATGKDVVADVFNALGYYLVGVEGDQGAYSRILRSSIATFNDKRLRTELAKTFADELPALPMIRTRKLPAAKGVRGIEVFELSYKLPKATRDKVFKVEKLGLYAAMATVGERTWIGFGLTEAAALDPVKLMISGGDYPKLSTREGLTALREHRVVQGSFNSLNSYAKVFAGLPFGPGKAPFGESLLRAMPHRGKTPSIFELSTSLDGPSATARVELPREVFEDGSAFTMAVVAAFASIFKGGDGWISG